MIGELNIDGVFLPSLLLVAVFAFCLTTVVRLSLRRLNLYRFIWHAGLFDVALFVVVLWAIAVATESLNNVGVK